VTGSLDPARWRLDHQWLLSPDFMRLRGAAGGSAALPTGMRLQRYFVGPGLKAVGEIGASAMVGAQANAA
jgi:hypothetical protein